MARLVPAIHVLIALRIRRGCRHTAVGGADGRYRAAPISTIEIAGT
jgi:hypothetical protein